jgi:UDP-glucose 4-epimerase
VINLGTGNSNSVLDLVDTFERVSRQPIKKNIIQRRHGDLPVYYASVNKAESLLNWRAYRSLENMCQSAWFFNQAKINALEN